MRPTEILGKIASSRNPESPGLVLWWWCELFCMDKGDEDLDGPRSARICPFSKCDYTRIVLFFGRNKKVSPMTLLALLIWRCWVYTAWQSLPAFLRAPRVQSATHVQLTSLAVDPVQVAWSYGILSSHCFCLLPLAVRR